MRHNRLCPPPSHPVAKTVELSVGEVRAAPGGVKRGEPVRPARAEKGEDMNEGVVAKGVDRARVRQAAATPMKREAADENMVTKYTLGSQ